MRLPVFEASSRRRRGDERVEDAGHLHVARLESPGARPFLLGGSIPLLYAYGGEDALRTNPWLLHSAWIFCDLIASTPNHRARSSNEDPVPGNRCGRWVLSWRTAGIVGGRCDLFDPIGTQQVDGEPWRNANRRSRCCRGGRSNPGHRRWGAFATRSRTTLVAATFLLNTTIKRLFDECTQLAMKGLAVTEMGDVFTADDYQRVLGAWGIMRDSMARDMQQNHPTEADHFLEK